MIFSIEGHIPKIINGEKTQTRRASGRYKLGRFYSIQPSRTSKAIPDGKIIIINKTLEFFAQISPKDAQEEGGYSPDEFERLYEKLHPKWDERYVYTFRFIPKPKRRVEE